MKRRSFRQDKIARVYDSEILPLWTEKFGRLLLHCVEIPPKAMILNVACRTGFPALEMLEKLDDQSRIIAIESSGPLLDVARSKAGDLSGRRIFFRTEHLSDKLSFADDVYDVTFTNLGLEDWQRPIEEVLADFVRVTKPGGQVLVTLPLRGTWSEFFDIYKEVLTKHDKHDVLEKLEEHIEKYPEPADAIQWMRDAGLSRADVEVEEFDLLFNSAREFFFAPVIEYGPLKRWKSLVGKGQEMQEIFWYIKEAIDAYFGGSAFSVSVVAACAYGTKPAEEEEQDAAGLFDGVDTAVGSGEEEEDELDSMATDPRRTPLPSKKKRESSFGRNREVSTVDEGGRGAFAGGEEITPRPSGLRADPYERSSSADEIDALGGQDFSGEVEELDVADIEELEVEPEEEGEPTGGFGDFRDFDGAEDDEDFPTLPPVRTIEEQLDEEDIPTMRPRPREPEEDLEEIDPDDVPTVGPHPSPFKDGGPEAD
jgi:ubiquinone/menaquinone biosynthesis C-methylase UbiE